MLPTFLGINLRVVSRKRLAEFWDDPRYPNSKGPLSSWFKVVRKARWQNFGEVKNTFNTTDLVGNKVVFDVGGKRYRVIAVINFENHTIFLRAVLDHKEYLKGHRKKDSFKAKPNAKKKPPRRA